MEQDFRALVVGVAALTGMPVNWGAHPQGTPWPGVVLTLVDDLEDVTLDGPDRLPVARVQVDIYAATYKQASELGFAVRDALNGHADERFQGIFLASHRSGQDTAASDRPYRVSMDFEARWNRT